MVCCWKGFGKNELIVGQGHDSLYLESNWCTAKEANWICDRPVEGKAYTAKFRYRQKDQKVTIEYVDETTINVFIPIVAEPLHRDRRSFYTMEKFVWAERSSIRSITTMKEENTDGTE